MIRVYESNTIRCKTAYSWGRGKLWYTVWLQGKDKSYGFRLGGTVGIGDVGSLSLRYIDDGQKFVH